MFIVSTYHGFVKLHRILLLPIFSTVTYAIDFSEQPIYELPQSNDLLENDIGLRHPESAYQQVIGLSEISVCCTKNDTPNFSEQPSHSREEIMDQYTNFQSGRQKNMLLLAVASEFYLYSMSSAPCDRINDK